MGMIVLIILLIIPSFMYARHNDDFIQVNPIQRTYIDSSGRTRLFHGVNFVRKGFPYIADIGPSEKFSINEKDCQDLLDRGVNVVRLGIMWPGLMPKNFSTINVTYLDQVERIVNLFWSFNIYSILDFHQDVLSPRLCGEGAPLWVNVTFPDTMPFPLPVGLKEMTYDPITGLPNNCSGSWQPIGWSSFYAADATGKAFQAIYEDWSGQLLGSGLAYFWKVVAKRFAGHSGILAYELMNEPWAGDIVKHPEWLVNPHLSDLINVFPLYQKFHAAIRENDEKHIVMYSPVEITNRLMQNVGFQEGPGGSLYNDRQSLVFHDYCMIGTDGGGPPPGLPRRFCNFTDGNTMKKREEDSKRLNTSLMMTEFGAVSSADTGLEEIRVVINDADSMSPPTSWAYWCWDGIRDPNDKRWSLISRSYAKAVAGVIIAMSFDYSTAKFRLMFTSNTTILSDTDIFLSQKYYYPNGKIINIQPRGAATYQEMSNGVIVKNILDRINITVIVTPK